MQFKSFICDMTHSRVTWLQIIQFPWILSWVTGTPCTEVKPWLKFSGLPRKRVWYVRGLIWNLWEILAVVIVLSLISSVCGVWRHWGLCDMIYSEVLCETWLFGCCVKHDYLGAVWNMTMWHDREVLCETWLCNMIPSSVTWPVDTWNQSFTCDMTRSYVTSIVYMWHDLKICDMTLFIRDMTCVSDVLPCVAVCCSVWHDPRRRVAFIIKFVKTWLVHKCDVTHIYVTRLTARCCVDFVTCSRTHTLTNTHAHTSIPIYMCMHIYVNRYTVLT